VNKHTVNEKTLIDFLRSFNTLQDCLARCDEIVVKVKFHIGYYSYRATVWSKKKEGAAK
jgi:hypothetical protein